MIVLGCEAFERWLGYEGTAVMDGISDLIKEAADNSLAPSAIWKHSEKMAV